MLYPVDVNRTMTATYLQEGEVDGSNIAQSISLPIVVQSDLQQLLLLIAEVHKLLDDLQQLGRGSILNKL